MQIFFILMSFSYVFYFLCKRKKADVFTFAYFCCLVYFSPAILGITTRVLDNGKRVYIDMSNELYYIYITILTLIFIVSLICDRKIIKSNTLNLEKYKLDNFDNISAFLLLGIILIFIISKGNIVFGKSKLDYMDKAGSIYLLMRYSIPIVFGLGIFNKNKFTIGVSLIGLFIDVYMSNRTVLMTCISICIIYMFFRKIDKPLIKYLKIGMIVFFIGSGMLIMERTIEPIQKKDWAELKVRLTSMETYIESITISEPFVTQTILQEVIDKDYKLKDNTYVLKNTNKFNSQFQKDLFPDITKYGMAENIWAEAYANFKWIGLVISIMVFIGVMVLLNIIIEKIKFSEWSIPIYIFVINWCFFIQRGSFKNQISRQFIYIKVLCIYVIITFIINQISKNIKKGVQCNMSNIESIKSEEIDFLNVQDKKFGAIGDGNIDDTDSIRACILEGENSGKRVYFPKGVYIIKDTLELDKVHIYMDLNVKILFNPYVNGKDLFNLHSNVKIDGNGALISTDNVYLEGSLIKLNDITQSAYNIVNDLNLLGRYSGIGVNLNPNKRNSSVCYNSFENINIRCFQTAIYLKPEEVKDGEQWVTANTFNGGRIGECEYYINIESNIDGILSDGNYFNDIQLQNYSKCKTMINCGGGYNTFNVFVWDIKSIKGGNLLNLDKYSKFNNINIPVLSRMEILNEYCRDRGLKNRINGNYYNSPDPIISIPVKGKGSIRTYNSFIGDLDNILSFADRNPEIELKYRGNYKSLQGVLTRNLYNPNPNANFEYSVNDGSSKDDTNFIVEISKINKAEFNSISIIGVTFVSEKIPMSVKVTLEDSSGKNYVIYDREQYGNILIVNSEMTKYYNATKINFEFKGIRGYDSNTVKLGRLYLGSNMERGNTYLDSYNTKVFGDVEFLDSKGSIIIKSNDGSKFKLRVSNEGLLSTTKL